MKERFLLWLQKIQFKLMLWVIGWRMTKKSAQSGEFRKHLDGKDIVLQFQTRDESISRHYVIRDQLVKSFSGTHEEPSTVLSFVTAGYAVSTMMKGDPTAFMKGVQEQKITAAGDLANLMWFMGAAKHLR